MHVFAQTLQLVKVLIVFAPAIFPVIAFFIQLRKANPFCWFWLVGSVIISIGIVLTFRHYGFEKFQNL